MSETRKPWHGVLVATSLQFNDDLSIDFGAYGENVVWLAEQGLHGVAPNGSLGEYQTLTDEERDQVVRTAVENAPEGFTVMPGVGAYGGLQSKRHAEVARDLGCQAVMGLPPNAYRTDERSLLEHFELIASAGLPVTAYNNPIDTKTDLRRRSWPSSTTRASSSVSRSSPATSAVATRSPNWPRAWTS